MNPTDESLNNKNYNFTKVKAGMNENTKDNINNIMEELTKNSDHYNKSQENIKKIDLVVREYKIKLQTLYSNKILFNQMEQLKNERVELLKKQRKLDQIWFHIDMDMYFAAVEIRDNPELEHLPVVVGNSRMVATSNYVARKFGIVSAMPGFVALKLCHDLIFIKPNMKKYHDESVKIMDVLRDYDCNIEVKSLDEACMNVTEYLKKNNIEATEHNLINLVKEMKNKIYSATKLTASIGIASNKMLAKIASDKNKPNGFFIVENDENSEIDFMRNLKIRKIPNIGEKAEIKYNMLDIFICDDIGKKSVELFYLLPENTFDFIYKSSIGIGTNVHSDDKSLISKSMSRSFTFKLSKDDLFLSKTFHEIVDELYEDVMNDSIIAKTITVEIGNKLVQCVSSSKTILGYIETKEDILKEGWVLLHKLLKSNTNGIRLMRVKLSNLSMLTWNRGKFKEANIKSMIKNMQNNSTGKKTIVVKHDTNIKSKEQKSKSTNNKRKNTSKNKFENSTIDKMFSLVKVESKIKSSTKENESKDKSKSRSKSKPKTNIKLNKVKVTKSNNTSNSIPISLDKYFNKKTN